MDFMDAIMKLETGEASDKENFHALQSLINSGIGWRLQGSYSRAMIAAIKEGYCALGLESTEGAYGGGRVPSRFEVKPGSKGSVEFVEAKGFKVLD